MVKLYVEGGGDAKGLRTACRKGFSDFITNAGLKNRPKIVAYGSRRKAFDAFCTAIKKGEDAILLVDSEAAISTRYQQGQPDAWQPWSHLKDRKGDGWDRPADADDTQCHLMVQAMENWFLADRETLKAFFGQGFKEAVLPAAEQPIESIAHSQVYNTLRIASNTCKTKDAYNKGKHSFELLAKIDPAKVILASPWAKRFVDMLRKKMDD